MIAGEQACRLTPIGPSHRFRTLPNYYNQVRYLRPDVNKPSRYLMLRRYYSPAAALRFLSPDSGVDSYVEQPQTWNLYPYVRSNPISLIDPSGAAAESSPDPKEIDTQAIAENVLGMLADAIMAPIKAAVSTIVGGSKGSDAALGYSLDLPFGNKISADSNLDVTHSGGLEIETPVGDLAVTPQLDLKTGELETEFSYTHPTGVGGGVATDGTVTVSIEKGPGSGTFSAKPVQAVQGAAEGAKSSLKKSAQDIKKKSDSAVKELKKPEISAGK